MNKNIGLKIEDIHSIRACFYSGGLHTRNELCEKTGLSPAAVINVLQGLMKQQEILYVSDAASTGGRRSKQYALNPEYGHIGTIACVKIHEQYVFHVMTVNLEQKKIYEKRIRSSTGTIQDLQKSMQWLCSKDKNIKAIAISIPGIAENGIIQICDFHNLEGADLNVLFPDPYIWNVENDVNTACIGFAYGHPSCRNAALLYQPYEDYTGCGFLINGKLYRGSTHKAGEMRYLADEKEGNHLKDPAAALWKDISAVQAVLDPQMIGWTSDLVSEEQLKQAIKDRDYPAVLEHIENMEELIETGLYQIGMNLILENKGEKHESRLSRTL